MLTWMFRRILVAFAAVCVLLLFLFPLVHGPFQATHGPTTAFGARKAFLVLLFSILYAAGSVLCRLREAAGWRFFAWSGDCEFGTLSLSVSTAILRC